MSRDDYDRDGEVYSAGYAAKLAQERLWGVTMRDCSLWDRDELDAQRQIVEDRPARYRAWRMKNAERQRRRYHERKVRP